MLRAEAPICVLIITLASLMFNGMWCCPLLKRAPVKTNPPRRGGPLCPPAGSEFMCLHINVRPLAGWMHRVCADLAGRYDTSVVCSGSSFVLPLIETNPLRRGWPLCPPAQEKITAGLCRDV